MRWIRTNQSNQRLFGTIIPKVPFSDWFSLQKKDAGRAGTNHVCAQSIRGNRQTQYGKLVRHKENTAALLTYYRNNILHVFFFLGLTSWSWLWFLLTEDGKNQQSFDRLANSISVETWILHAIITRASRWQSRLQTLIVQNERSRELLMQDGDFLSAPSSEWRRCFPLPWLLSRAMQKLGNRYGCSY